MTDHPSTTVSFPEGLEVAMREKRQVEDLAHWGQEALVVEAARQHLISRRKAASLLGMKDEAERQAFYERHGLDYEYTEAMLEEDRQTLGKMFSE